MEIIDINEDDLKIDSYKEAVIPSPLGLSTVYGDSIANYVEDSSTVILEDDKNVILDKIKKGESLLAFEKAGPREKIFFSPENIKVAIVTCGGLCPGINNVIRSLVMELHYRYGVQQVLGIRYGRQFIVETLPGILQAGFNSIIDPIVGIPVLAMLVLIAVYAIVSTSDTVRLRAMTNAMN